MKGFSGWTAVCKSLSVNKMFVKKGCLCPAKTIVLVKEISPHLFVKELLLGKK